MSHYCTFCDSKHSVFCLLQDLSANDTSKSEACNKPSEELKELLSDSLEFDYWSSETLAAAVNELSSASVGMSR